MVNIYALVLSARLQATEQGRRGISVRAIRGACARPPYGCGRLVTDLFDGDPVGLQVYLTYGLCASCQIPNWPLQKIDEAVLAQFPETYTRCLECGRYRTYTEVDGKRQIDCCPTWLPDFDPVPRCCRFGIDHRNPCEVPDE